MLLIFPPVAKPGEPPAGIARLAGALGAEGVPCRLLDANLEGQLYLLGHPPAANDTWTRRAVKHAARNLDLLRTGRTYLSFDRYSRAVRDVQRVLEASGAGHGTALGLADYEDATLFPVRSRDLIAAADQHKRSIFFPYFKERLAAVIQETFSTLRPAAPGRGMIGISLNYLSQALTAFAMAGFIRKEFPEYRIVLGGGLVTSWIRRPGWRNPFGGLVDHLVAGPGEGQLLALLGVNAQGPGTCLPEYGPLPLREYLSPGVVLPYSGSSGCYWSRCSFCPETAEDNPYLPVPTKAAAAELRMLSVKHRPVLVHLLDNAVSPAFMNAIAENPPGVPWYGFARIRRDLADPDFCASLRRSGCVMIKLGLESGDQTVLDSMQKGIDLDIASRALRSLEQAGIACYVYLLFGVPAETPAAARKTLDFVVRHRSAITFLNLAVFNMPVGGREALLCHAEPFSDGDLSLYADFRHPEGWGRRQVRQFLDREFRRHEAVAAILRRDPPVFTSNHAPFFLPGVVHA